MPKSWNLQYYKNGGWVDFPIYVTDSFSVFKDKFNVIHPKDSEKEPIITNKLRLNITPQTGYTVGILKVEIDELK